jgi:hypothetical protein
MSDKPPVVAWRRSLACHQGSCVEVAKAGSIVLVQDSKNPGVYQAWSQREWGELLRCIKVGWRPEGVSDLVGGCVEFGLDRHDDKQSYTAAEWKAFEEDVIDDKFEFDKLPEFGELSEGVSAGPGSVAGSGEAATGAVDGSGHCSDGPGSPVPVAAELGSLDDELDTLIWSEDPSLGEPQGPPAGRPVDASTDEVDLSSAVQPGSDAAGTGTPPVPVPAAQPRPIISDEAVEVLARRLHRSRYYGPMVDDVRDDHRWNELLIDREREEYRDAARAHLAAVYPLLRERWEAWSADDEEAWARAVAPLVPAVETQETVS